MVSFFLVVASVSAVILGQASATHHAVPNEFGPSIKVAASRGPQIFNSVYDALRKWGCTVHPNGMSFFLATVPEGVLFHHGNGQNVTPTALDWLAYEIEHAEMFARPKFGGPGDRGPGGKPPAERLFVDGEPQHTLHSRADGPPPEEGQGVGWLHTYRTTRPLQFLYLDGMSGDKDNSGVVDTQDYVLRAVRPGADRATATATAAPSSTPTRPPGPPGEYQRAIDLCDLCAEWGLQGVIRIEGAGTEIIKCDFFDGLEEVQSLQRSPAGTGPPHHRKPGQQPGKPGEGPPGESPGEHPPRGGSPPGGPGGRPGGGGGNGAWGPRRPETGPETPELGFRDVGAERTLIDFSSMVSAFFFPVNLSNPEEGNDVRFPRLNDNPPNDLLAIKKYLAHILAERRHVSPSLFNWRDVADLIVRRYGPYLAALVSTDSADEFANIVRTVLSVFVDYSVADAEERNTAACGRCAAFYIQTLPLRTESDRLLYAAFEATNARICDTLFDVGKDVMDDVDGTKSKPLDLSKAQATVKELVKILDWSVFDRNLTNTKSD